MNKTTGATHGILHSFATPGIGRVKWALAYNICKDSQSFAMNDTMNLYIIQQFYISTDPVPHHNG